MAEVAKVLSEAPQQHPSTAVCPTEAVEIHPSKKKLPPNRTIKNLLGKLLPKPSKRAPSKIKLLLLCRPAATTAVEVECDQPRASTGPATLLRLLIPTTNTSPFQKAASMDRQQHPFRKWVPAEKKCVAGVHPPRIKKQNLKLKVAVLAGPFKAKADSSRYFGVVS